MCLEWDAELEYLRTYRERFERVVFNIQSQNLGEMWNDRRDETSAMRGEDRRHGEA
jgi:hypothetical protein